MKNFKNIFFVLAIISAFNCILQDSTLKAEAQNNELPFKLPANYPKRKAARFLRLYNQAKNKMRKLSMFDLFGGNNFDGSLYGLTAGGLGSYMMFANRRAEEKEKKEMLNYSNSQKQQLTMKRNERTKLFQDLDGLMNDLEERLTDVDTQVMSKISEFESTIRTKN